MRNNSLNLTLAVTLILAACTVGAQTAADWSTQADSLRGRNGQTFAFACPAGGALSLRVWGTDLYTDDSSICSAAVHAGLIRTVSGGTVTVEIRPGQPSYAGSARNGVTSRSFGSFTGSFAFVRKPPVEDPNVGGTRGADWTTQADSLRGHNGEAFSFYCPGGGIISNRVWGTDLYTDDSSICSAAVHAGLITTFSGGRVTITIRPGQPSYAGSARNGVTSKKFGSWQGSFAFSEQTPTGQGDLVDFIPANARPADWKTQADPLRGHNGETFTFACPAGGTLSSRLWGTGVHTDDSSICTAAVHAGLITAATGGRVTIKIRPGQSSYEGSTRFGVTSKSYGSWSGSFTFVGR